MKNSKLLIFILSIILLIVVIKFMKGCRFKEGFNTNEFTYDETLWGNARMDTNDEKQLRDNIKKLGTYVDHRFTDLATQTGLQLAMLGGSATANKADIAANKADIAANAKKIKEIEDIGIVDKLKSKAEASKLTTLSDKIDSIIPSIDGFLKEADFNKYKATQQATDNNQNKDRNAFINTRYAGKIDEIEQLIEDSSTGYSSASFLKEADFNKYKAKQETKDSEQDNALLEYSTLKAPLGRVLWVNECKDDAIGQKICGTNIANGGEVLHQLDDKLTDEDEAKLLCKKKAYERNLPYKEVQFRPGFPKGCIKDVVASETWLKNAKWRKLHGLTGSESMWHLIHDNEKHNLYQDTEFNTYSVAHTNEHSVLNKDISSYRTDHVMMQTEIDKKQDDAHKALKSGFSTYSVAHTQKHSDLNEDISSYRTDHAMMHATQQALDKKQDTKIKKNYDDLEKWVNIFETARAKLDFKVKCQDKNGNDNWNVENCPDWLKGKIP